MKKPLYLNAFLLSFLTFLVFGMLFWLVGCKDNSVKPGDVAAPSAPTNLRATAVDSTTIDLIWNASIGKYVVCSYNVYRGTVIPVLIGNTTDTSFRDTGLLPRTVYVYTVEALSCSKNRSDSSASARDTTLGDSTIIIPPSDSTILQSAASFAIFAAAGITNTGNSVVNGDIGMTPGTSFVGFPPGTYTGTLHVNDSVATKAKLDWQTAYNDLAGRPCDVVSPSLNGTLSPQVYCFPSSAGLGTLTLSGSGLYVFQIGSTLTTATGSSVTLTNGATADKVFWVIGSSATLGTNTAFQGTIIAYSSITLNTGATITNGRVAALNGAVTLDNNIVTKP